MLYGSWCTNVGVRRTLLIHLRKHISTVFAAVQSATLATYGSAGLLAHRLPCIADGLCLVLLLPQTSDHLVNLATSPAVVVVTDEWLVRGNASIVFDIPYLLMSKFRTTTDKHWSTLLKVRPVRIDIAQKQGWGAAETFDLNELYQQLYDP
jgi:hypothetical protein